MDRRIAELRSELQVLIPVADGIVQTFGRNCEVAVHDLSNPAASLVYLAGTITNRPKGAPVTNIVFESLRKCGNQCHDLIAYKNVSKEGRILKSSTIFIRDAGNVIIGCLCINYDITDLTICKTHLEHFAAFNDKDGSSEHFAADIAEVVDTMIEQVVAALGIPIPLMQKEDKMQLVSELDHKGVFLIKGAVEKVAGILGVSRYTVYNYLDEGRANRSQAR